MSEEKEIFLKSPLKKTNNYPIPEEGTTQSKLTEEQIKKKLANYKGIDPTELYTVTPGTWIKYFHKTKKEFRVGGVVALNRAPEYFILKNPYKHNISWSVRIDQNVFFVPDKEKFNRIKKEKDELYKLYIEGKIELKK